jgi:hypothetical protein
VNQDLLAEAKQRLPLSALMAQLGFADRAQKSARCPFHDDSSASFSLYIGEDGEERWKCFAGCGQGDAIDFLAKHRGMTNADACREFIRLAGVTPPPAPPGGSNPSPSAQPSFDWQSCVTALTPDQRAKLANWRGYAPKFVGWLHTESLIGLFDGERIAFPVHGAGRNVTGCHYRLKADGSWRYHPTGTHTAPFIIGDPGQAQKVFAFESPWDLFAVLDAFHWHIQPLADTVAVATRGASNARLLAGLCAPDALVYAFGQNDPAGQKWLAAVAAGCGRKTLHVVTPAPHKDPNDWTRAGATAADIRRAIAEVQPVPVSAVPDLHAPPPPRVSKSVTMLPAEDTADEPEASPFPVDALPPALAGIIAAVSHSERVPLALPAVCALGVASAAIGAGLEVASGPNRVTRANLHLLASAESGSGKSETFRLIAAPLLDHQRRLLETWRLKTSPQLQSEIRVLDKEIATLERKAAKSGDPMERDRMLGELEFKLARKDDLARRAAMPCIIAQDVTTERLAVLLRDNREVVFSASADARKLVDNLLGRYNPGKTTDESLYLSAYSGDFVRVDRQGRDTVVLNKPCLALCWFIQPDLLGTMLDEQSLSVSGFLPRLLVCHTNAAPRRIEGEVQVLSDSVRNQWTQLIADLLATFHAAGKPQCTTPTPEALAVLTGFHNRIVDRRTADLADVGAFAARYAENAWRLSVVLHAARWAGDAGNEPLAVETAANAVRIVEWFAASQLDILARGRHQAASKVEDEVLELLATTLQRKAQDFTTAREVHRARIVPTADAARALLDRMEREGVLTGEDVMPPHGGRATRVFRRVQNPVPE